MLRVELRVTADGTWLAECARTGAVLATGRTAAEVLLNLERSIAAELRRLWATLDLAG